MNKQKCGEVEKRPRFRGKSRGRFAANELALPHYERCGYSGNEVGFRAGGGEWNRSAGIYIGSILYRYCPDDSCRLMCRMVEATLSAFRVLDHFRSVYRIDGGSSHQRRTMSRRKCCTVAV